MQLLHTCQAQVVPACLHSVLLVHTGGGKQGIINGKGRCGVVFMHNLLSTSVSR